MSNFWLCFFIALIAILLIKPSLAKHTEVIPELDDGDLVAQLGPYKNIVCLLIDCKKSKVFLKGFIKGSALLYPGEAFKELLPGLESVFNTKIDTKLSLHKS